MNKSVLASVFCAGVLGAFSSAARAQQDPTQAAFDRARGADVVNTGREVTDRYSTSYPSQGGSYGDAFSDIPKACLDEAPRYEGGCDTGTLLPALPGTKCKPRRLVSAPKRHKPAYCKDYEPGGRYSSTGSGKSCSPELKTKNVTVLEKSLNDLLKTRGFAQAQDLKATVAEIRGLGNVDSRIGAYLNLVGVDARSPQAVAAFVGAGDLAPYAEIARVRFGLSESQARTLAETLSAKLLNSIND